MIPKAIHFCWFGGKPYPKIVKKCLGSWKKYCPDYEIKLWNEHNYDVGKNPWLASAAQGKRWAFVSDYARLDIVFHEGGIYLDTDVELIKSLDDLLPYECFLGMENGSKGWLNTGLGFGAVQGHPAVGEMLHEYDSLVFSEASVGELLCPVINTRPFLRADYRPGAKEIQQIKGATILPSDWFDPNDGNLSELHITRNTHGIHWSNCSWETGLTRWKAKLRLLIGQKNVQRIKSLYKRKTRKNH